MAHWLRRALALGIVIVATSGAVLGQDAALRDRVGQLVGRLGDDDASAREAAEKALIALGPRALPLLPEGSTLPNDAARQGLERVREALAVAEEKGNLVAKRVTIEGKGIRLTDALKQLQQQSGNLITDLREQLGGDVTNPQMDLALKDVPFFAALDEICQKGGVATTYYTGDGSIGLTPGAMPYAPTAAEPSKAPVVLTGPFRVAMRQYTINRDFGTGQTTANAQFEIAWEPRLRPMLLALKSESVAITDDRGETIEPTVPEESSSIVIRPENPVAEINLNMTAPDRAAKSFAKLKVKAEMTLPAGLRAFRFADLTKPLEQKQGELKVGLSDFDVDEHVWKFRVQLDYPGQGPAFESYQQGLFNNRLWFQAPDGGRLTHDGPHGGGFNTLGSDGGRLAFEYLFVDVPGKPSDYSLVYETPSRVETVPIEFEFVDVPLP